MKSRCAVLILPLLACSPPPCDDTGVVAATRDWDLVPLGSKLVVVGEVERNSEVRQAMGMVLVLSKDGRVVARREGEVVRPLDGVTLPFVAAEVGVYGVTIEARCRDGTLVASSSSQIEVVPTLRAAVSVPRPCIQLEPLWDGFLDCDGVVVDQDGGVVTGPVSSDREHSRPVGGSLNRGRWVVADGGVSYETGLAVSAWSAVADAGDLSLSVGDSVLLLGSSLLLTVLPDGGLESSRLLPNFEMDGLASRGPEAFAVRRAGDQLAVAFVATDYLIAYPSDDRVDVWHCLYGLDGGSWWPEPCVLANGRPVGVDSSRNRVLFARSSPFGERWVDVTSLSLSGFEQQSRTPLRAPQHLPHLHVDSLRRGVVPGLASANQPRPAGVLLSGSLPTLQIAAIAESEFPVVSMNWVTWSYDGGSRVAPVEEASIVRRLP